ncbi:hypothetical protein KUV89_04585 [Marinobacter hydrocarbonoclasticus]|nr:hypothetical protein [Marinobacter nauticus]
MNGKSKAYQLGLRSFRQSQVGNPYPVGSEAHTEFERGWAEALAQSDQHGELNELLPAFDQEFLNSPDH